MLIVQGGDNGFNDFYLPNFLRVKFDYPTTRYPTPTPSTTHCSTPTPSTTHYSTPTPMNGKVSEWTGIESNES